MKARAERINHGLCHGFVNSWELIVLFHTASTIVGESTWIMVLTCDSFIPVVQFEKRTGGSLSIGG